MCVTFWFAASGDLLLKLAVVVGDKGTEGKDQHAETFKGLEGLRDLFPRTSTVILIQLYALPQS